MTDNQLIASLAAQLDAASAAAGWNYPVIQKDQPTLQGVPYDPTIFFEKIGDYDYGHPMIGYIRQDKPTEKAFNEKERQWCETTFQISAFVIQEPEDLSIPTASDVVGYLKRYLSGRPTLRTFQSQGISLLRVTNLRNPFFLDDRKRFEANPSFDIVLRHIRDIDFVVGAAEVVEGETVAGFDGEGTYPVPDEPWPSTSP